MTTIGILLDHSVYGKLRSRKTGHERVDLYRKAAREQGADVLYMSLRKIDTKRRRATGYIWRGGKYRVTTTAIPAVIHNRALPFDAYQLTRLKKLGRISYVFNALNRYKKLKIHRLLRGHPAFHPHLPATKKLGRAQLASMMQMYDQLFVKPQSGSVGLGIIRMKRLDNGLWQLRSSQGKVKLNQRQVYGRLKRLTRGKPYVIQKAIDLATYKGRPYDLRVSVQRGESGSWQVTGIIGKVARRGGYLTNVARGGSVKSCEQLFEGSGLPVAATKAKVLGFSSRVTAYLASRLRRLGDVGLDIGVDQSGSPQFIEMNGRDQRYSFAKGGLKKTFYQTYANPVRYAIYLARRRS